MEEESFEPSSEDVRACTICGAPATKLVISNLGCWKLCARESCWNRLTSRHPKTDLTWLQQPLDEEDRKA